MSFQLKRNWADIAWLRKRRTDRYKTICPLFSTPNIKTLIIYNNATPNKQNKFINFKIEIKYKNSYIININKFIYNLWIYIAEQSYDVNIQHLGQRSAFDFYLRSHDLEVNRDHLFSRDIHCTKFGNFQAKKAKEKKYGTI